MSNQHPPVPQNPYVGPYPIQAGQPFFGRKTEIAELASRLIARRVVLLHAPSGAGKTSLVQAGLAPEMLRQNYLVLPTIHLNHTPLQNELTTANPNRFILSCLLSLDAKLPEAQRTPVSDLAARAMEPGALVEYVEGYRQTYSESTKQPGRKRTLVIFDQFEEILTIQPADRASKEQFFNELMPLLDDNHYWVLFAMREDFLARLDPYLGYFPERLSAHFQLDFLGLEAARQAIEEPVKEFGVAYSQEAIELLLHDLSLVRVLDESNKVVERPGSYIEPVELQVVCERLWRSQRGDPALISLDDVQQYGKVIDALANYYADSVEKASAETKTPLRNIRQWFEQALIAEGGLRQPVPQGSELEFGVSPECTSRLVDAYLVRVEEQRGTLWHRLAHDRLVEAVIRDNARWNVEKLSLLQRQALLWDREGRPEHLLLQDASLIEAERWLQGEHDPLNPAEQALLDRSRQLQQKKEAEIEKERLSKQRIRRYFFIAVGVAAVAIAALIFAIWALGQIQTQKNQAVAARGTAVQAQKTSESAQKTAVYNSQLAVANADKALAQSTIAAGEKARALAGEATATAALGEVERLATQSAFDQSRALEEQLKAASQRLAFQSQQIANQNPDLSALLSIEAYKASHTTEATNILLSSIYTATVSIAPVGDPIGGFSSEISSLAISPDEKYVAVGCTNGDLFLIDLQTDTPQPVRLPYHHTQRVYGLSFSPDGTLLASSGYDSQLYLYSLETKESKSYPLAGSSSGLSFRPDGLKLAVNESFDYVIYDVTPRSVELGPKVQNRRERNISGFLHDIAYSPDGAVLAISEEGESGAQKQDYLTLFNADTGDLQLIKGAQVGIFRKLAWSPDNRTLFTSTTEGWIFDWDTLLKSYIFIRQAHENKSVYGVAVSYDGRYLLSGGYDGFVRLWSLPDLQPLGAVSNTDKRTNVMPVVFSPNSYLFVSGGTDRLVTVRRLVTQPSVAEQVTHENGAVRSMAVTPQGELFWLYPDRQSGYHYVRSNTGFFSEKPAEIDKVYSAALRPDGMFAAYGGEDGIIYTVDVNDPFANPLPALPGGKPVRGLAFSQDGKRLAASICTSQSADGKCLNSAIWLTDLGSQKTQFLTDVEGVGLVRALAFDPSGEYLAAGAENGNVSVIDTKTGKPILLTIKPSPSEVLSLAYSRDGRMLAGGNRAGDMLLWNAASEYQDLGRLNIGSLGALYSLAFDPDGVHLYTGGSSGDIMRWAISPDLWIDIICKRIGRNMTSDEWREYFFNNDLQKTCPSN
jgi:WD40 repeat protein